MVSRTKAAWRVSKKYKRSFMCLLHLKVTPLHYRQNENPPKGNEVSTWQRNAFPVNIHSIHSNDTSCHTLKEGEDSLHPCCVASALSMIISVFNNSGGRVSLAALIKSFEFMSRGYLKRPKVAFLTQMVIVIPWLQDASIMIKCKIRSLDVLQHWPKIIYDKAAAPFSCLFQLSSRG